jgi:hypothetical protein
MRRPRWLEFGRSEGGQCHRVEPGRFGGLVRPPGHARIGACKGRPKRTEAPEAACSLLAPTEACLAHHTAIDELSGFEGSGPFP